MPVQILGDEVERLRVLPGRLRLLGAHFDKTHQRQTWDAPERGLAARAGNCRRRFD